MNNKYKINIGLELHLEILTKTKIFSPSLVSKHYGDDIIFTDKKIDHVPNTNISPMDLGYPGSKPVPNRRALNFGYSLANSLNMEVPKYIMFDRKCYFYPDLAKGYQITQFKNPIGKAGVFKIINESGGERDIEIIQIHLEEDTAKQKTVGGEMLLDFNRSGIGLIEVVTNYKSFTSKEDIILFLKQFRQLVIILGISNGDLSKGEMRIDLNISLSDFKGNLLTPKMEIKNLNSFRNIEKSIDSEYKFLEKSVDEKATLTQQTKRYDEGKEKTIFMREKATVDDYLYVRENNINPILLDNEIKGFFSKEIPSVSIYNLRKKLLKNLENKKVNSLLENKSSYIIFNILISKLSSIIPEDKIYNKVWNFVSDKFPLLSKLNSNKIHLVPFENRILILYVLWNDKVDRNIWKVIFSDIFNINSKINYEETLGEEFVGYFSKKLNSENELVDINNLINYYLKKGIKILNEVKKDEGNDLNLEEIITNIIKKNDSLANLIQRKPDSAKKMMIGLVMKETNKKADIVKLKQAIDNIIK